MALAANTVKVLYPESHPIEICVVCSDYSRSLVEVFHFTYYLILLMGDAQA